MEAAEMTEHMIYTECRDADQFKRICELLTRNRRVEERVHKLVLGGPHCIVEADILEDALQSNLGTMHQLERILKERAG